jgi:hypothetical protein
MSDRTKAMDDLIAQDADLIDIPSLVTEADREVLIRLSNPDDETAQRIRRGLIYTWEVGEIARHRKRAAAEERARIIGVINKRMALHNEFINSCVEHDVRVGDSFFGALAELRCVLRGIEK